MGKKESVANSSSPGRAKKSPATKRTDLAKKTGRARKVKALPSEAEERIKALARFPDEDPNPVLRLARNGNLLYANKASRPLLDTWGWHQEQPLPAALQSLLAETLHSRASKEMEVESNGRIFSLIFTPIVDADYVNVYGRDITHRRRIEEELENTLANSLQTQREVSALLSGARVILEYREFKDAARSIFDVCRNLIGAKSGYIALLSKDESENELLFLESGGLPCTVDPDLPMPTRGLREVVYRTCQTVFDNNFSLSPWMKFMPPGHVKLDNVMFAPLIIEKKAVGLLGLANKPGGFTENDIRLAAAFGDLAAIALQNSRILGYLEESNESLQRARGQLEQRVEERTAELVEAIARLRVEVEERWRAQERLQESEQRYKKLVGALTDYIYTVKVDQGRAVTTSHSPGCMAVTGYAPEEYEADPHLWYRMIQEEDRPAVIEQAARLLTGEAVPPLEHRLVHKDGSLRWVRNTSVPRYDEQKRLIACDGLITDITGRRRAEEELKSFAKNMDTIINSSSDFIVLKDKDFRFLLVNERCGKFFNAPMKDIIGKTDFDFLPPEMAEECRRSDERALNSDDPVYSEENAGDIWLHVVKQKVVDAEGEAIGIVAVMRDITERKKAEEALRASEKECRFLSSQLLLIQEHERKRISQELHDGLGQTLSAIKFRLEHALQPGGEATEPAKAHHLSAVIPMIQGAVEEIRGICMDLRPTMLDDLGILATMNWFCREFQASYPGVLVEQEINLEEQEIPSLLKIVIYRVLQETFNNIAQHSGAKNIRLGLGKKDGTLELVVEDNGHGFSLEDRCTLNDGKRGMGISSMRERVELSGGTFAVDSVKGAGTKVKATWKVSKQVDYQPKKTEKLYS